MIFPIASSTDIKNINFIDDRITEFVVSQDKDKKRKFILRAPSDGVIFLKKIPYPDSENSTTFLVFQPLSLEPFMNLPNWFEPLPEYFLFRVSNIDFELEYRRTDLPIILKLLNQKYGINQLNTAKTDTFGNVTNAGLGLFDISSTEKISEAADYILKAWDNNEEFPIKVFAGQMIFLKTAEPALGISTFDQDKDLKVQIAVARKSAVLNREEEETFFFFDTYEYFRRFADYGQLYGIKDNPFIPGQALESSPNLNSIATDTGDFFTKRLTTPQRFKIFEGFKTDLNNSFIISGGVQNVLLTINGYPSEKNLIIPSEIMHISPASTSDTIFTTGNESEKWNWHFSRGGGSINLGKNDSEGVSFDYEDLDIDAGSHFEPLRHTVIATGSGGTNVERKFSFFSLASIGESLLNLSNEIQRKKAELLSWQSSETKVEEEGVELGSYPNKDLSTQFNLLEYYLKSLDQEERAEWEPETLKMDSEVYQRTKKYIKISPVEIEELVDRARYILLKQPYFKTQLIQFPELTGIGLEKLIAALEGTEYGDLLNRDLVSGVVSDGSSASDGIGLFSSIEAFVKVWQGGVTVQSAFSSFVVKGAREFTLNKIASSLSKSGKITWSDLDDEESLNEIKKVYQNSFNKLGYKMVRKRDFDFTAVDDLLETGYYLEPLEDYPHFPNSSPKIIGKLNLALPYVGIALSAVNLSKDPSAIKTADLLVKLAEIGIEIGEKLYDDINLTDPELVSKFKKNSLGKVIGMQVKNRVTVSKVLGVAGSVVSLVDSMKSSAGYFRTGQDTAATFMVIAALGDAMVLGGQLATFSVVLAPAGGVLIIVGTVISIFGSIGAAMTALDEVTLIAKNSVFGKNYIKTRDEVNEYHRLFKNIWLQNAYLNTYIQTKIETIEKSSPLAYETLLKITIVIKNWERDMAGYIALNVNEEIIKDKAHLIKIILREKADGGRGDFKDKEKDNFARSNRKEGEFIFDSSKKIVENGYSTVFDSKYAFRAAISADDGNLRISLNLLIRENLSGVKKNNSLLNLERFTLLLSSGPLDDADKSAKSLYDNRTKSTPILIENPKVGEGE